jgi:hypothetical protein
MEWPEIVFIAMVVIGLVGEFFSDAGVFLFSRHLQTISDRESAALNKEAGDARRDAGNANERAALAEKATEDERMARIQLEKSMMWRHLSGKQRTDICAVLASELKPSISFHEGDEEGMEYAREIRDAINTCSGSGRSQLGYIGFSMPTTFGVSVKFDEGPDGLVDRKRVATALGKLFAAKVTSSPHMNTGPGVKLPGIGIEVGRLPLPRADVLPK